jgi:hypothetical protein
VLTSLITNIPQVGHSTTGSDLLLGSEALEEEVGILYAWTWRIQEEQSPGSWVASWAFLSVEGRRRVFVSVKRFCFLSNEWVFLSVESEVEDLKNSGSEFK